MNIKVAALTVNEKSSNIPGCHFHLMTSDGRPDGRTQTVIIVLFVCFDSKRPSQQFNNFSVMSEGGSSRVESVLSRTQLLLKC